VSKLSSLEDSKPAIGSEFFLLISHTAKRPSFLRLSTYCISLLPRKRIDFSDKGNTL
jgi:hypothetical protein